MEINPGRIIHGTGCEGVDYRSSHGNPVGEPGFNNLDLNDNPSVVEYVVRMDSGGDVLVFLPDCLFFSLGNCLIGSTRGTLEMGRVEGPCPFVRQRMGRKISAQEFIQIESMVGK